MAGFTVRSRGISEGRGATPAVPSGSPLNADKRFYAALPPYNVKADGRTITDAAINAGQATLTSASAAFAINDVGKLCVVVGAGTPVSGTTSGSVSGSITALPVNALASAIPPGGVILTDGTNTQGFVTTGALAGATSIPLIGPSVSATTSALSTGAPIASIAVAALNDTLPAGSVTLSYVDAAGILHTQTFSTTGAAQGASSIPVTSQTPNYAFPVGTQIFGSPAAVTANATYALGSTVRTNVPALSTVIQGVSGGAATLAANAGTTVSGAECFYATDDTAAAQHAITDATSRNGTVVLSDGDIGLSAALNATDAVALVGQGVKEFYGGAGVGSDSGWPTIAPYLRGTVLVQCAANTDIFQPAVAGRTVHVKHCGMRFAGKFQNTGHGLSETPPANHYGNIGGVYEDVRVFGQDGNHYGFHLVAFELVRHVGLRAYGGGGMRIFSGTVPGPPGNSSSDDCSFQTFIAGIAHAKLIDGSAPQSPNQMLFTDDQWFVSPPSPAIANTTPPTTAQQCLQTFGGSLMTEVGFVSPGAQASPTNTAVFPSGPGCYRTSWNPVGVTNGNPSFPGFPNNGVGFQNLRGCSSDLEFMFSLTPTQGAQASTTLSAAAGYSASSLSVVSTAGFSAGQAVQIDTGANIEYAIIASVGAGVLNLDITKMGNAGIFITHASGAAVKAGAAVVYMQLGSSNAWPGARRWLLAAPINAASSDASSAVQTVRLFLPAGYWCRLDWVNATNIWSASTDALLG